MVRRMGHLPPSDGGTIRMRTTIVQNKKAFFGARPASFGLIAWATGGSGPQDLRVPRGSMRGRTGWNAVSGLDVGPPCAPRADRARAPGRIRASSGQRAREPNRPPEPIAKALSGHAR